MPVQVQDQALLLYNDECGVCRLIARWVGRSAQPKPGQRSRIVERPIGHDPVALRSLHPDIDIWDAYATIHLLMPDGSMKLGGEAVAEVLRRLPNTRWFAWLFALRLFGFAPFQGILNVAYIVLADVRPLLGCESCGIPRAWMKPIGWTIKAVKGLFSAPSHPNPTPHFASLPLGAHPKASPGGA